VRREHMSNVKQPSPGAREFVWSSMTPTLDSADLSAGPNT
jgi:hypothetical protein